jgi:hypothetical protein
MPPQAAGTLAGALVAVSYASAVLGVGALVLRGFLGPGVLQGWARRDGLSAVVALAFVAGQGLAGVLWLGLALAGALAPQAVWSFIAGGCAALVLCRDSLSARRGTEASMSNSPGFYVWIRRGIVIVLILTALGALAPTKNDDALLMYLVTPHMIAVKHVLDFQPYVMQHGLMPLQVEMHWAALFAVSNETAVALWDYLSSLVALLAVASLGASFNLDFRASSLLLLMLVTTPSFTLMMGAGKPDNAAVQFGLAAFLWLRAAPIQARRAALASGLCLGWAMASRYTSFVLGPAWLLCLLGQEREKRRLDLLVPAALGAAMAWTPMLFKNWFLVGQPLAPLVGDSRSSWLWHVASTAWNLSWTDVLFHPFVWTFGDRPFMLGNISPLFLGLLPPWFLYRQAAAVRQARLALVLGTLTVGTWVLVEARALHTRYLLVGLALTAIGLAPAFTTFDEALGSCRRLQHAARAGLGLLLTFWLAISSWSAYEGLRCRDRPLGGSLSSQGRLRRGRVAQCESRTG